MKSASSSVARPSRSPRSCRRVAAEPLPVVCWTSVIDPVQVEDRQRRLIRLARVEPVDRGIADADPALARHAGEEAHRRHYLLPVEPPQQVGEQRDLLRARARCRHLAGGGYDIGEERYGTATTPLRSATSDTMSPMMRVTSKSFGV